MTNRLADFQGEAISLDTNLLVGLVDAHSVYHPACVPFFQRAVEPTQPIRLITTTLTLDEVLFILLQEMIARELYRILWNGGSSFRMWPKSGGSPERR
jgi:hypothetical protein